MDEKIDKEETKKSNKNSETNAHKHPTEKKNLVRQRSNSDSELLENETEAKRIHITRSMASIQTNTTTCTNSELKEEMQVLKDEIKELNKKITEHKTTQNKVIKMLKELSDTNLDMKTELTLLKNETKGMANETRALAKQIEASNKISKENTNTLKQIETLNKNMTDNTITLNEIKTHQANNTGILTELNEIGKNKTTNHQKATVNSETKNAETNEEHEKNTYTSNVSESDKRKTATKTQTYANVLNRSNKSLIIKAKTDNITIGDIKKDMTTNINPQDFHVDQIRNISKTSMAIQCDTEEERNKLKEAISSKLGEKYDVAEPTIKNMQMKLVGMSTEQTEEELISIIKQQNNMITEETHIKILKIFKNKNVKYEQYGAIIEMQYEKCQEMLKRSKLKIGWDICKLYEYTNVMRCFKCHGFNHTTKTCTKNVICSNCTGEHSDNKCKSEEVKCSNCTEANKKYNLNINTKHNPYNRTCETLIRQINKMKKKLQFE